MTQDQNGNEFDLLLDYLKRNRGFDFTGYKRSTLVRRINKRMSSVGIINYQDYMDYLEVHPEEFTQLFNTILINVTSFFRDPESWEYIFKSVLPKIIETKDPGQSIRIWSAGCASGEEAYTIAILLAELLGEDQFHNRVKIYATDLDEEALTKARAASYTDREIENVPEAYIDRYFDRSNNRMVFRKDLRRSVIFGRHDLIQDAPISKVDLLICRNILMYFNSETQTKVLARLHFALNDGGFLFLGRAEMLLTHANLFTPVELRGRLFVKVPRINLRDRLMAMAQNGSEEAVLQMVDQVRLRDFTYEHLPISQILLDNKSTIILANERARNAFGISIKDIGRPFQDISISYRPVELRSAIDNALTLRETVILREVEWITSQGERILLEVHIIPLFDNGGDAVGVNILFQDITKHKILQEKLEHTNQELETALEELQSTNEELETTNEELQSTIEELETMNEELQSTNEELETMNEELRIRTEELNHLNLFMESILTSLHGGVMVLDQELRIQVWNRRSEDLWGLRPEEVEGHNFLSLDIGLPVEMLKRPIRAVLTEEQPTQIAFMDATNRRGRLIHCKVTCTPLFHANRQITGVILIVQEVSETEAPIPPN